MKKRERHRLLFCYAVLGTAILLFGSLLWDRNIAENASIFFYGKVVDVNGKGLGNAMVTLKITRGSFFHVPNPLNSDGIMYDKRVRLRTDQNGDFQLSWDRGRFVIVDAINLPG